MNKPQKLALRRAVDILNRIRNGIENYDEKMLDVDTISYEIGLALKELKTLEPPKEPED